MNVRIYLVLPSSKEKWRDLKLTYKKPYCSDWQDVSIYHRLSNLIYCNSTNWDISRITDLRIDYYLDDDVKHINALNYSDWDVSNVVCLDLRFRELIIHNIETGFSRWNTLSLQELYIKFYQNLQTADYWAFSNFNTSLVTIIDITFAYCAAPIDVAVFKKWDLSSIRSYCRIFRDNKKYITGKISNLKKMYYGCDRPLLNLYPNISNLLAVRDVIRNKKQRRLKQSKTSKKTSKKTSEKTSKTIIKQAKELLNKNQ